MIKAGHNQRNSYLGPEARILSPVQRAQSISPLNTLPSVPIRSNVSWAVSTPLASPLGKSLLQDRMPCQRLEAKDWHGVLEQERIAAAAGQIVRSGACKLSGGDAGSQVGCLAGCCNNVLWREAEVLARG